MWATALLCTGMVCICWHACSTTWVCEVCEAVFLCSECVAAAKHVIARKSLGFLIGDEAGLLGEIGSGGIR